MTSAANEQPVLHRPPSFLTASGYAGRIRAVTAFGLVLATVALASACGGSGGGSGYAAQGGTTTSTTTAVTTSGVTPLEGAGTAPVEGAATASGTALLERVAVGRHEGYDRVVFQFRNQLPGYRVAYVERPITEDGSGNTVDVQGDAVVLVRMGPASRFDVGTGEGVMTYKGPKRIAGSDWGTSTVKELVRSGDFEAVLSWAIGLSGRVDFRVRTATSPARLIVDFRNQ